MNDLIPTPVTDKNGRQTIVHKRGDGTYGVKGVRPGRELPNFPTYDTGATGVYEAVNTVSDSQRKSLTPSLDELGADAVRVVGEVMAMKPHVFDTANPMYLRRHMKDDVYYFATQGGGETSIAIPRLRDELRDIWVESRVAGASEDTDEEVLDKRRYEGILNSSRNPKEMSRHDTASEFAYQNSGMDFSGPTMVAIAYWGKKIDELYPDVDAKAKAHALKDRVIADTSDARRFKNADPSRFWDSFVYYNSYAS